MISLNDILDSSNYDDEYVFTYIYTQSDDLRSRLSSYTHKRDKHSIVINMYLSLSELSIAQREFNDVFKRLHVTSNDMNIVYVL